MGTTLSKFTCHSPAYSPKLGRAKSLKKERPAKTAREFPRRLWRTLPTGKRNAVRVAMQDDTYDHNPCPSSHVGQWSTRVRPVLVYPSDQLQKHLEGVTLALQGQPHGHGDATVPEKSVQTIPSVHGHRSKGDAKVVEVETQKIPYVITNAESFNLSRYSLSTHNVSESLDDFYLPSPHDHYQGMSMLKSRLDSKIDAQIQKHARQRSKSCTQRLNKYNQAAMDEWAIA